MPLNSKIHHWKYYRSIAKHFSINQILTNKYWIWVRKLKKGPISLIWKCHIYKCNFWFIMINFVLTSDSCIFRAISQNGLFSNVYIFKIFLNTHHVKEDKICSHLIPNTICSHNLKNSASKFKVPTLPKSCNTCIRSGSFISLNSLFNMSNTLDYKFQHLSSTLH